MKKIVAWKSLPEDVLAYLQQHAEVVQVDPAQHDTFVAQQPHVRMLLPQPRDGRFSRA